MTNGSLRSFCPATGGLDPVHLVGYFLNLFRINTDITNLLLLYLDDKLLLLNRLTLPSPLIEGADRRGPFFDRL